MKLRRLQSTRVRRASDRGEVTRQRLLKVAIQVFAARGFDGARTRDIAEAARTNLVSIAYYFGSKQGLYDAAALHVADHWSARERGLVQQARMSMSRPEVTQSELVEILCTMLSNFLRVLLGHSLPEYYGKFVSQAASGPPRAFRLLIHGLAPLRETLAEAIARLTGESATSPGTQVRALTLIGTCVYFRRDRSAVLHALKWKRMGAKEIKVIEKAIRANIQAMFSQSSDCNAA
jgi:AcrR family transcriptional regulator